MSTKEEYQYYIDRLASLLTKKQAKQLYDNLDGVERMPELNLFRCSPRTFMVYCTFDFRTSKEGHDYWFHIANDLPMKWPITPDSLDHELIDLVEDRLTTFGTDVTTSDGYVFSLEHYEAAVVYETHLLRKELKG